MSERKVTTITEEMQEVKEEPGVAGCCIVGGIIGACFGGPVGALIGAGLGAWAASDSEKK